VTAISGTAPQDLVAAACERIASGELDVALIVGGEARWTAQRTKRDGVPRSWEEDPGPPAPETLGGFEPEMIAEMALTGPAAVSYALFEDAIRSRAGRTVPEQRDHCASLWARFSEVAEHNPHAWDRTHHSVERIRDASPENRMIAFPYTKAMVANNTVNMASALVVSSAEVARAAGVAEDRMVHPLVVTSSHETWEVLRRDEIASSPALTTAGRSALEYVGLDIAEIDHVDLYACFPSIVQMSSAAIGLAEDGQLTQTGGLGFAGAALSNAVGHSIAATVERVRGGGVGLVHGNGGSATKQSFAIYAPEPRSSFARIDCQDRVELGERDVLPVDFAGEVTVDAATVRYDREGPSDVLAAVRAVDGRRAWATSEDRDLITLVETDGIAGGTARRSTDGILEL
ncbi:MAG: hypothetical protein JST64_07420, partial [Actinobacteria bacterium]|nr:hypothetical protein [Actinomycetota bacterium]